MGIIDRVIQGFEDKRENVLNGNINCIPSPIQTFRNDFVGIEQGRYYLVSAAQKCGKTQITNYLFMFHPILYAFENPDKVKIKIFYYPLEEKPEQIVSRYISFLLYKLSKGKIRYSIEDLNSVDERKVLPQEIIDILKTDEYQNRLKFFEECVSFQDSSINPTGIWKDIQAYADEHGTIHRKEFTFKNKETGLDETRQVFDYYTPNDPKEYVMIVVDHVSLLNLERDMSLRESINKMSEYFVRLRNRYNYIPIAVQQQSVSFAKL